MKKLITAILLTTSLTFGTVYADDASHKEAAMAMSKLSFKPIDFEQMQIDQALTLFRGMVQANPSVQADAEQLKIIEGAMIKVIKKWTPFLLEKSLEITSNVFLELYSEEEINEMIKMFKTDIGQKYLANQQAFATKVTQRLMPHTAEMQQETQVEIMKALAEASNQ